MTAADVAAWSRPVSDADPCGPDLEFDPDFASMERAALGKPEQEFGGKVIPAEPPDWREVEACATRLLERTRDLRVLAHLALARLRRAGPAGFADALEAIEAVLREQWEHVHPKLDPEDGLDPTPRANALHRLGEPGPTQVPFRDLVLARSERADPVTWRQLGVLVGGLEADPGAGVPTEGVVRAAFEQSAGQVAALRAALARTDAALVGIRVGFDAQAGSGTGPDYSNLLKLLREIRKAVEKFAVAETGAAEPAVEPAEGATPEAAVAIRNGAASTAVTSVGSRAEAVRLLGLVAEYFARQEPSNPAPLLIERARRLAEMNFLDILRDLAPDGVQQARHAAGVRDE